MAVLPDEMFMHILDIGVKKLILSDKDLCSFSMSCKSLDKLSNEDTLWGNLLTQNYSQPTEDDRRRNAKYGSHRISFKNYYKGRFVLDKQKKIVEYSRSVFKVKEEIKNHSKKLKDLQPQLMEESERIIAIYAELASLLKSRKESVAEQCAADVESRITNLKTELNQRTPKHGMLNKARINVKQELEKATVKLNDIKRQPYWKRRITQQKMLKWV